MTIRINLDKQDKMQSIYSAAMDIARLVLLVAFSGFLSEDRRRSIKYSAERIIKDIEEIKN